MGAAFAGRADGADFASFADGDAAAPDDFAALAEDDNAAMVVASPKASVRAALIAAGDASDEWLRLLERVRGRAALLLLRRDVVLDGSAVLVGRSGTACRAPTGGFSGRLVAAGALAGDAAGADAFRFSCMGVCGSRRAGGRRFRQARDVVESEDRAEKRVVMCGAEEFAAASRARTRQPHGAAQAERYDGDAVRRHGFGRTGPAGRRT